MGNYYSLTMKMLKAINMVYKKYNVEVGISPDLERPGLMRRGELIEG